MNEVYKVIAVGIATAAIISFQWAKSNGRVERFLAPLDRHIDRAKALQCRFITEKQNRHAEQESAR